MTKYTVTISKCMAARVCKNDLIEDFEDPKYGFYWWFWMPLIKDNGGRFKRGECVDVSIMWLCFSFGFIFWPWNKPKHKHED